MAIITKKYYTEAVTKWHDVLRCPEVNISVMHEDGTPVTGLVKSNFKFSYYTEGGGWWKPDVISIQGSHDGFYLIRIEKAFKLSPDTYLNWNFSPDLVMLIEVIKEVVNKNTTTYRGTCLAPMLLYKVS